ncbi:MAG: hypothetical protein KatS3mg038_1464 [Candidatus Kapaibacterium sp.]|nr:MAG: hypothetical protein KatS3mg038_1464 [Candidatus Kapabacteria bacterium]
MRFGHFFAQQMRVRCVARAPQSLIFTKGAPPFQWQIIEWNPYG